MKRLPLLAVMVLSLAAAAQQVKGAPPTRCDEEAAAAQLRALEPRFDQFREATFTSAARLKELLKTREDLVREYTAVATKRCGCAAVDALVMLARVDEELALKFTSAPAPKGLDAEQLALYRSELEARAQPIREVAQHTWDRAVREAKAQGSCTAALRRAEERLKTETAAP